MSTRARIRELAASTPDRRERSVDAVRAAALVLVVVGHWLAVVLVDDGERLAGRNLLHLWDPAQALSWAFQVMPALFLVGGFANAASWRSPHRATGALEWVGARHRRLLTPVLLLVLPLALVAAVAVPLGADRRTVATVAWLGVFPLWFLALYVLLVETTPLVADLEQRFGVLVVLAFAVPAVLVDAVSVHLGVPYVGEANYVLVWGAVHTMGIAWQRHGWPVRRGVPSLMLVGGAAVAVLLVTAGPYPTGLLYAPGSPVQNASPPSTALLAYAVGQTGLVLLVRGLLERACRGRLWVPVVAVNAVAMTVYVWHMVPVVLVALPAYAAGLLERPEPMSGAWFALRPVWLAACGVVLLAVVAVVGRLERVGTRTSTGSAATTPEPWRGRRGAAVRTTVVATGVLTTSLALLAVATGGAGDGGPAGVPWAPLAALVGGVLLVAAGSRRTSPSVDRADRPAST